jgi:hypothetical protein
MSKIKGYIYNNDENGPDFLGKGNFGRVFRGRLEKD